MQTLYKPAIQLSKYIKALPLFVVILLCFNKSFSQDDGDEKSRLFLITVIDSDDEIIGERCQEDLEQVTDAFNEFSSELGNVTIYQKTIEGSEYSKASVNNALDNWLPSQQLTKDDIVVFYFSGHGFRLNGDASVYPRMWLKTATNRDIPTNNLRMKEDVYDRIVKMGAGVNIVLSDCCNSVPDANTSFTSQMPKKTKKNSSDDVEKDIKDFNDLFSPDEPVSIIATAADSTELAGGTATDGGFFTYYFLEALDDCIYEDDLDPTWNNVLSYARDHAAYDALAGACPENKHNANGRCIQTAKFTIEERRREN